MNIVYILLLTLATLSVHFLKATRFYFILSGNGFGLKNHIRLYAKTSLVSVILPFKIGELFRIFVYARHKRDFFCAACMILLDRFFDTAALCTFLAVFEIYFRPAQNILLCFLLFSFCAAVSFGFLFFASTLFYWKRYFLEAAGTNRNLYALKIISYLEKIQREIASLLHSSTFLLFVLSLLAWGVEILFLYVSNALLFRSSARKLVFDYLNAALFGRNSVYLRYFSVASAAILLLAYIGEVLYERFFDKKR